MFWKKNKTENNDKANKGNREENEIYYKCPFKSGDTITIDTANLVDYPIGVISDRTYFRDSFFYVSWQTNLGTSSNYFLSGEIPKVSTNKNQWEHFVLLSDYIKEKTKEEGYLIAKVAPINGYVVTDNEADMYYAALFDFTIKECNAPSVLVRDNRLGTSTLEICAIKEILSRKEYQKRVKAEIVCTVDAEPYHHRVRVREENSKLRKTLINEYGVDPQQLKNFEMQENCKPLLKQYQETSKYKF